MRAKEKRKKSEEETVKWGEFWCAFSLSAKGYQLLFHYQGVGHHRFCAARSKKSGKGDHEMADEDQDVLYVSQDRVKFG